MKINDILKEKIKEGKIPIGQNTFLDGKKILENKYNLRLRRRCDIISNALNEYFKNDPKWMQDNNIYSIEYIKIPFRKMDPETLFKHAYLVANTDEGKIIIDASTSNYRKDKCIFIGNVKELEEDLKNLLTVNWEYYAGNSSVFEEKLEQDHTFICQYIYHSNYHNDHDLEKCVKMLLGAWYGNDMSKLVDQDKMDKMKSLLSNETSKESLIPNQSIGNLQYPSIYESQGIPQTLDLQFTISKYL